MSHYDYIAQDGDTVTVTFQGSLEDGSVFEASDDAKALTLMIGANEGRPGPREGYCSHHPPLDEEVPLATLPDGLDLRIGNQLEVTAGDGRKFRVRIVQRSESAITLDANHPLAGHTLTFHIELVGIERPTIN